MPAANLSRRHHRAARRTRLRPRTHCLHGPPVRDARVVARSDPTAGRNSAEIDAGIAVGDTGSESWNARSPPIHFKSTLRASRQCSFDFETSNGAALAI